MRNGNWESDLKRLLVSVQLAGEENQFSNERLRELLKKVTKTYRHAIKRANKVHCFNDTTSHLNLLI